MIDEIKLFLKFSKIRKKGYIKSLRKGTTGAGYTFESLIGKKEDKLVKPDFKSIEIKVKNKFDNRNITLFNITPKCDSKDSIKHLVNNYGYPDKTYKKFNIFMGDVYYLKRKYIGNKFNFRTIINNNNKLILQVFNNNELIDESLYWDLNEIRKRLELKCKKTAIVLYEKKCIKKEEYYKYTNINYYILKDFNLFLEAIKNNTIIITFKIGIRKKGERFGELHDHGSGFVININNLEKIYKKYDFFNK